MGVSEKAGFLTVNNVTYELAKLSKEEKHRLEHLKMHEKHRGHETMHLEMFLVLIITLVLAQIALVQWKKNYFRSYQRATLIGMWIIPVLLCVKFYWVRFMIFWAIFSIVTGLMTFLSTRKPLNGTTPRRVYAWFLLCYKISYVLGIVGYIIMMGTLFGFNVLLMVKPNVAMDAGLLFLFYGLYFGVTSRDFAEVCSDTMASNIGYYTRTGVPTRRLDPDVCAICGNAMVDSEEERNYKLNCSHVFHEYCIRGWCIVGKKQTCPYCKEKVDLKLMFKNPWEKPHVLYGNLLDWIRYLVAWQPVIIFLVQGVNWVLGLE